MKKKAFNKLLSLIFGEVSKRLAPLNKRSEDFGMELNNSIKPALDKMAKDIADLPLTLKGVDGKTPTQDELRELITPLIPAPIKGDDGIAPTVEEIVAALKSQNILVTEEFVLGRIKALVEERTPTADELREIIQALIPAPIKGDDGKAPTKEELVEIIQPLIPAPVKGEDGKTPTADELKELIVPLIPAPVKGDSPTKEELIEIIQPLIPAPIKGADGKTPTADELKELIVPLIPAPVKGEDGKSPTAKEVALELQTYTRSFVTEPEFMQALVEAVPPPREGKDGKSVTIEEVKEFLTLQFAQWALEFERRGHDAVQRAIDNAPKAKDGMSFDELEYDGERRLTWKREGAVVKEIVLPTIIDREVWQEGSYERGDAVSFGGNLWIARCDTTSKPGPAGGEEGSKHWRLAVRKGRDAKGR